MNYNLGQLEELFTEIKELMNSVKTNKNYFMFLANLPQGEKLEYELTKESLPHLLGINTTYLVSTSLFSSKNSYYVTLEMLEDPYKVHNAARSGAISYEKLFSKHITKKIKGFKDNINVDPHSIGFVCKYDKTKTYSSGEDGENYEYIFITENTNGNIGLLCLAKNNNGIYSPMSSQLLETDEEKEQVLNKLLRNQEITLLNAVHITGFKPTKLAITFDEQKERIYTMRKYKDKYNCSIDMNNNCLYFINMLQDNKNIFSQAEDASTIKEQSKELEKIRGELAELRALRASLSSQITKLESENITLQEQVNCDANFKAKLLKLTKELEN